MSKVQEVNADNVSHTVLLRKRKNSVDSLNTQLLAEKLVGKDDKLPNVITKDERSNNRNNDTEIHTNTIRTNDDSFMKLPRLKFNNGEKLNKHNSIGNRKKCINSKDHSNNKADVSRKVSDDVNSVKVKMPILTINNTDNSKSNNSEISRSIVNDGNSIKVKVPILIRTDKIENYTDNNKNNAEIAIQQNNGNKNIATGKELFFQKQTSKVNNTNTMGVSNSDVVIDMKRILEKPQDLFNNSDRNNTDAGKMNTDIFHPLKKSDNNIVKNVDSFFQKRTLEVSLKESLKDLGQLKCYMPGEHKTTRHLMLEMNEFYFEMAEQLRNLKGNLLTSAQKRAQEIDENDLSLSRYESELQKLIGSIEESDQKVVENMKKLKEIKEERGTIHEEIKSLNGESNTSTSNVEEECKLPIVDEVKGVEREENKKVEKRTHENNNDNSGITGTKKKKLPSDEKDFIAKNKELAKEYNMTRCCLTDEEKKKLEFLLSDIDICEEKSTDDCIKEVEEHEGELRDFNVTNSKQVSIEVVDCEDEDEPQSSVTCVNGFTFNSNDTEVLSNLEQQLSTLKDERSDKQENDKTDDIIIELKEAESKGKHWKYQLLLKRLNHIEKYLELIQIEKGKENEDNEKTLIEEIENRTDMEEEYRKSVDDMSIDISELEYDDTKNPEKFETQSTTEQ